MTVTHLPHSVSRVIPIPDAETDDTAHALRTLLVRAGQYQLFLVWGIIHASTEVERRALTALANDVTTLITVSLGIACEEGTRSVRHEAGREEVEHVRTLLRLAERFQRENESVRTVREELQRSYAQALELLEITEAPERG